MARRTASARLAREIVLRHAHVAGAEDAAAGTGNGCVSTVTGATPLRVRIGFMRRRRSRSSAIATPAPVAAQEPHALHQLAAIEEAAAVLGMAAQDLVQRRVVETLGRRAGLDDRAKLAPIALGVEPLADRGLAHRVGYFALFMPNRVGQQ